MDDVRRRLGDPHFGFPCDLIQILRHGSAREKGSYENEAGPSRAEKGLELVVPLDADGAVTGHGFDQHEPVFVRQVNEYVGHLSVLVDLYAKALQVASFDVSLLLTGVTQVDDNAPRG